MELSNETCELLKETAQSLRGAERRWFQARTVRTLGLSQRRAHQLLGWNRVTLIKALREYDSGVRGVDNFSARGRKPIEHHLPRLLDDIRDLVQDQCQTDPTFRTTRLFCRLTAREVRRQLIEHKGYTDEQLPTIQTINTRLNALGFRLRKVAKCRPLKKCPRRTPSLPT